MNVKENIDKFHPNRKNLVISSPIVRTDKKDVNNVLQKCNNIFKHQERNVIFLRNILALHRDGLHLNAHGTIMLAGNRLSRTRTFRYNVDSSKET